MSFEETYSIRGYGEMISDRVRMEAYTAALRNAVETGSVVLDIGTGTGIFALLACRFGARRVYAIEPSVSIQLAREIAAANGLLEKIEFIDKFSTEVTLPEPADVIISDLRSVLPTFQSHFVTVTDARRRLLAPGGTLIPRRDFLRGAVVHAESIYRAIVGGYTDNGYGFDMTAALRYVTSEWRKGTRLQESDLRTEPQTWATLDYSSDLSSDVSGQLDWVIESPGTAHGLCVWFDAELASGIGFSNAPGEPDLIYGRAFFPWPEPIELQPGDEVRISLRAKQSADHYVWTWNSRVVSGTTRKVRHEFRQSTFNQAPMSLDHFRRRTDRFVPQPTATARVHGYILDAMQSGSSLGEIARRTLDRFPDQFSDWDAAFHEVAELADKYSA